MAAAKRLKSAVEKHCILLFHRVFIGILNYHVMKKRLLSISQRELSVVIIYYIDNNTWARVDMDFPSNV